MLTRDLPSDSIPSTRALPIPVIEAESSSLFRVQLHSQSIAHRSFTGDEAAPDSMFRDQLTILDEKIKTSVFLPAAEQVYLMTWSPRSLNELETFMAAKLRRH